ncbi:9351_t:CDS:2 [Acaulospora colombiana]|uniref:9351_t:CDS:1 n=1 Tax=Acaulospora colombiana TaxID=27376 RepID=A0ACA9K527_9GLOM|nr:9351_t:CDS:2 [Acaulospora colombiana]
MTDKDESKEREEQTSSTLTVPSEKSANSLENIDQDDTNDNNVQGTSTAKVKKKKKKKNKSNVAENESTTSADKGSGNKSAKDKDDLDQIVAHIMRYDEKPQTNSCSVPKCKQSLAVISHICQYCNMKYCIAHRYRSDVYFNFVCLAINLMVNPTTRHPEAHSPKCVEKARNVAHAGFKQESMRFISQERRNPGSTNSKNFNANESKEDLKKRYREKLDKARREERGGKGS